MTPLEHNKYVGLAQLGYAGFHLLTVIVLMSVEGFMFENIYSRSQEMGGPPPPPFLVLIFIFVGIVTVAMTIPSIVAGYALLKRRPWAKVAGIVGGVVAATSFPIGTGLAVYTFWFLFSDVGKQVYGGKNQEPPPLPPKEWQPGSSDSAHDGWVNYTPPPSGR
jgi:uncharacterized BrkB/YihY/UPF0761 family membrane protein